MLICIVWVSVLPAYTPVELLNGKTLPFEMDGNTKVFHLIAEEFEQEFSPGYFVKCWGYNGQTPGPLIEAVEGDKVRILVTNHLPEPTTVHWHGIILPSGMDGVTGLNQPPIPPGETFVYEFSLKQNGTYMYHSHYDEMTQIGMGLVGMFVIHPETPYEPKVDRDYAIMLQEWYVPPGGTVPDPSVMADFNIFTFNGHLYPGIDPILAQKDERVRIRIGNLSMDSHPIHLHGHTFTVTGTGAGRIPESARIEEVTVNVPVGSARDIEFIADNPGDWAFHCHKTHHMMSGMGHGIPNMLGVELGETNQRIKKVVPGYMPMGETGMGTMFEMRNHMKKPPNFPPIGSKGPFSTIDMTGMFTIVKIRETLDQDPGWYDHPKGTTAHRINKDAHR
jgi:FtsP/CotA-like multicopper oxidase with cupredoxin domain